MLFISINIFGFVMRMAEQAIDECSMNGWMTAKKNLVCSLLWHLAEGWEGGWCSMKWL